MHSIFLRSLRWASSSERTHYQVLELLPHASLKEIKMQFKRLLKKFHPDVNARLPEDEKEANSARYVQMVLAYETLKDAKKKREYDALLSRSTSSPKPRLGPSEWQKKYYGEAKYFSRSQASTHHSLANRRYRVHNFYNGTDPKSHFSGQHKNHDRHDVPHFNYEEHLAKHLKFEQHLINKQLLPEDRKAILRQLAKDGDISGVSEELITKHLMRQAQRIKVSLGRPETQLSRNPYMYQGPQNGEYHEHEALLGFKTAVVLGGAGSAYLLYHMLG